MNKKDNSIFSDGFDQQILLTLTEAIHENRILPDEQDDVILSVLDTVLPESASRILGSLKMRSPQLLKKRHNDKKKFEKRLNIYWGEALNLLEMFIHISIESGDQTNEILHNRLTKDNEYLIDALTKLHGRACQVSNEILCLLRSGFSSAANARWRTLHEIAVVVFLISEHGNDLAERYLGHIVVEEYDAAQKYQKYAEELNQVPFSDDELKHIATQYQMVCSKYGENFRYQYGWAAFALGKRKPIFEDLEQAVNIDHLRPYYKWACDSIHVTAKGIMNNIDLLPNHNLILAGPSNFGLADPGQNTALSLYQINVALIVSIGSSFSNLLVLKTMDQLVQDISTAFIEGNNLIKSLEDL